MKISNLIVWMVFICLPGKLIFIFLHVWLTSYLYQVSQTINCNLKNIIEVKKVVTYKRTINIFKMDFTNTYCKN